MPLIPRKGRVIGQLIQERDESSLIIAPFEEKKQFTLQVTAVGPEVKEVKVGDVAILPAFGGTHVTLVDTDSHSNQEFYVIDEDHILAVYRDDAC